MTDLNELFEQILHSEQKFKARIDELKLVAIEVDQSQSHIQVIREEARIKHGELAVKRNKLAGQEVETKILRIRKEILTTKKDVLCKEKKKISSEIVEAEKRQESNRVTFINEMSKFSQYYDLLGSGSKHRDEQLKKTVSVLQEELLLLETELVEIKCQQEEVNKLKAVLTEASHNLAVANKELEETTQTEKDVMNETKSLEKEKSSIDQILCQEPEFVRLHKELESCKESTEELTCKQLSKELDDLQRQCYHKQMRQQLVTKKGARPSSVARSSCKSGHYNPYTLRYVPAPTTNEQSPIRIGEEFGESLGCESDSNEGDSIPEWDVEMGDDEDLFAAECKDQHEFKARDDRKSAQHIPSSTYHTSTSKSTSKLTSTSSSELCSVMNWRATNASAVDTKKPKSVSVSSSRKQSLSAEPLNSPTPRKRQGESIVKTTRQDSKKAKKVRFHY